MPGGSAGRDQLAMAAKVRRHWFNPSRLGSRGHLGANFSLLLYTDLIKKRKPSRKIKFAFKVSPSPPPPPPPPPPPSLAKQTHHFWPPQYDYCQLQIQGWRKLPPLPHTHIHAHVIIGLNNAWQSFDNITETASGVDLEYGNGRSFTCLCQNHIRFD